MARSRQPQGDLEAYARERDRRRERVREVRRAAGERRGIRASRASTAEGDGRPENVCAPRTSAAGWPGSADVQRLVELLTAAQGRSVTLARLSSEGIECPDALACQLELAGAPVRRVFEGGRTTGARLDADGGRPPDRGTTLTLPAGYVSVR